MLGFLTAIGYQQWVLPALLAIPLMGAVGIWVHGIGRSTHGEDEVATGAANVPRMMALVMFAIEFVVSLGLWWSFDPSVAAWQSVVDWSWIPSWGIRFTLGVDGIAVMMILLTTFIMVLAVGGSWTSIRARSHSYYALMLILTTGMLGVFMALDLFLFYVMWEVMLVPMYFIVGVWGGDRRIYASIKFFLYTMVGSMLMLAAIVYLGLSARDPVTGIASFNYDWVLQHASITSTAAKWLFGGFFLAFAVKVPMFPFHTWLPDAHVEAPTAGSVVLASIMLKLGTFGFLRLAVPLFPTAAMNPTIRTIILSLAVIGIVYGALVSLVQPDFKKLVAYSSVSHLGLRDARHLRAHGAERAGRADGDDQPRHLDGRAVPPRRHDLRTAAHAVDRGVRRHRAGRPDVRRDADHRHVQQHRRPRHERVRRRVPRPDRRVPDATRSSRSSRRRP